MSPTFTADDIGKPVETAAGEELGVVTDVDPGTAYVEPAPDATDSAKAVLDWERNFDEAVPLADDAVSQVTDESIRLEAEFREESITTGTTAEDESSDDRADEPGQRDVDYAPGEPVASNPTETATDVDGTDGGAGTGELDDEEPMVEDDEFYDTDEGDARADPSAEMAEPNETASEEREPTDGTPAEEESATESSDRDDVAVDPDEATDGNPEAELNPEEDVGRRRGPDDSSE